MAMQAKTTHILVVFLNLWNDFQRNDFTHFYLENIYI